MAKDEKAIGCNQSWILRHRPGQLARLFHLLLVMSLVAQGMAQETANVSQPLEVFRFTDKQEAEHTVSGRVLVVAADGGLLVEDQSDTLWNITPSQLMERKTTGSPFAPLSAEERVTALKAEFGIGFEVAQTEHYLIVSNAGTAYTEWCGTLLEKFLAGYMKFWAAEPDLGIQEPANTLVVVILANKAQFDEFYRRDEGRKTQSSFGYYSIRRNRVVLHDFASSEDTTTEDRKKQTVKDIKRAVREVPFNVATIVHEATHQLGFNTGLHTRYADNPVWLTEGLAMYFETPDLGSGSKWTRIGRANDWRKDSLKAHRNSITGDSIKLLVDSDTRFRTSETAAGAYTEAWALTTYLMKRKRKELMAFIKKVAGKPRMIWDKPEQRAELFERTIGKPEDFEGLMASYLKRIR